LKVHWGKEVPSGSIYLSLVDKSMNNIHNYFMNVQRVTISLPRYLYNELTLFLEKGQISHFISEAIEQRLIEKKIRSKDTVSHFFSHRKYLPKLTDKQVMSAIRKGRI